MTGLTITLSLCLSLLFLSLGIIHLYWLIGGTWGLKKSIPKKIESDPFRPPPKFATLLVALILLFFTLLYVARTGLVTIAFPKWIGSYAYWAIPILFIIRAIGEFRYVGFFKSVKETEFAKADTQLFSPLCLATGISGLAVQLLTTTF